MHISSRRSNVSQQCHTQHYLLSTSPRQQPRYDGVHNPCKNLKSIARQRFTDAAPTCISQGRFAAIRFEWHRPVRPHVVASVPETRPPIKRPATSIQSHDRLSRAHSTSQSLPPMLPYRRLFHTCACAKLLTNELAGPLLTKDTTRTGALDFAAAAHLGSMRPITALHAAAWGAGWGGAGACLP